MSDKLKKDDGLDDFFKPAQYNAASAEKIAYSNYSYWRSTFRTFSKSIVGMTALVVLVLLVGFAFFQPYFPNPAAKLIAEQTANLDRDWKPYEYSLYMLDMTRWKEPPSSMHWFGIDEIGRDYWARVWEGTRIDMRLAAIVAVSEIIIGSFLGAIWGYVRGLDKFMIEVYNILANIPNLILLSLFAYIMKPSFWTLCFAMVSTGWIVLAKTTRNLVFIIRDREYNMASECLGTPLWRMVIKNLLPQLMSIILLRLALLVSGVVASEAVLTFLGVGLPNEIPSLGVLMASGRMQMSYRPHLMLFPSLIVSFISVGFYIVGNTLSDACDPKNHV